MKSTILKLTFLLTTVATTNFAYGFGYVICDHNKDYIRQCCPQGESQVSVQDQNDNINFGWVVCDHREEYIRLCCPATDSSQSSSSSMGEFLNPLGKRAKLLKTQSDLLVQKRQTAEMQTEVRLKDPKFLSQIKQLSYKQVLDSERDKINIVYLAVIAHFPEQMAPSRSCLYGTGSIAPLQAARKGMNEVVDTSLSIEIETALEALPVRCTFIDACGTRLAVSHANSLDKATQYAYEQCLENVKNLNKNPNVCVQTDGIFCAFKAELKSSILKGQP